jgi:hypothetical protein
MNRPTFQETVSVLVKAYLNDKLKHGDCTACVVGNLCGGNRMWEYLFITDPLHKSQFKRNITAFKCQALGKSSLQIIEEATNICLSTGYSVEELKRIEYSFETAPGYIGEDEQDMTINTDEWMFNGLMAVVDVLAEIHGVNLETKSSAKLQFVKI